MILGQLMKKCRWLMVDIIIEILFILTIFWCSLNIWALVARIPSESMKQISTCWLGSLFWITSGLWSYDYSESWMNEKNPILGFFKN